MKEKGLAKKIILQTILFIGIMLFIGIFEKIFGQKNMFVGVTTIISLLISLGKDLTKNPLKNFIILIVVNIAMGIAVFWSVSNVWIGIIINFVSLFLIGYYLGYTLTRSLILPYGLQYLFMLYAPVYGNDFTKRILALIAGPILIMAVQFIIHKLSKKKVSNESSLVTFEDDKSNTGYRYYTIFGKKVRVHRIRLAYALKLGILTAVTCFITQYFHLVEGRWMTYTIFSLTEFYSDKCKIKAKKKLQGTLIGVIIVMICFVLIKNKALRGLIILIAGYLNSFAVDYRDIAILVTITAVAPVALSNGTIYAVVQRILYAIIGIILALIANKLIIVEDKSV